jgi:hypothetical protein
MTKFCWEGEKEDGDGGMIFWVKTRLAVAGARGWRRAVGGVGRVRRKMEMEG